MATIETKPLAVSSLTDVTAPVQMTSNDLVERPGTMPRPRTDAAHPRYKAAPTHC